MNISPVSIMRNNNIMFSRKNKGNITNKKPEIFKHRNENKIREYYGYNDFIIINNRIKSMDEIKNEKNIIIEDKIAKSEIPNEDKEVAFLLFQLLDIANENFDKITDCLKNGKAWIYGDSIVSYIYDKSGDKKLGVCARIADLPNQSYNDDIVHEFSLENFNKLIDIAK